MSALLDLAVYAPLLLKGTVLTVAIALASQVIGTTCGLMLALARMSSRSWLWFPTFLYIWIARGTPALVHLFFVYFALPPFGIQLEPIPAAIIALSISSSAYNAEIFRAGIASIPAGQIEAAKAIGMSYFNILRLIILPQAVRVIIGPYMSTFISHVKSTSLASVITVPELMLTTEMIYSITYRVAAALFVAASIYLVLTTLLTLLQLWLEKHLAVERRPLSAHKLRRLGHPTPAPNAALPAADKKQKAAVETRSGPVITVQHISKSFGSVKALDDISLTINQGEVVCLLGPSGSGKSTLLRCLNLLEVPESGRIKIDMGKSTFDHAFTGGAPPAPRHLIPLRTSVGMVFQHFNLWPHKAAFENVVEGLVRVRGFKLPEAIEIGKRLLLRVGLGNQMAAFPDHLSGGQRQRVAIARALAMEPTVMLFDEPTSSLDPELVGEVLDVIESVAASGMTTLIATHEMGFARKIATRIIFMDGGRIIEDTTAEEFFTKAKHERSERFVNAILR